MSFAKKTVLFLVIILVEFIVLSNLRGFSDQTMDEPPAGISSHFASSTDSLVENTYWRIGRPITRSIIKSKIYIIHWIREAESKEVSRDEDTEEDLINNYIYEICERYQSVDPELVMSIVYHESRYNPDAKNYNGSCVGLMQLSKKYHTSRAERLTGKTDLFDPYTNLVTGIDFLNELIEKHGKENLDLVLMLYNGSGQSAYSKHASGTLTPYARNVLETREVLRGE